MLGKFSPSLADTIFSKCDHKLLILAGQHCVEGLGLALNNIENDIMKQIVKVHSERERHHEEAHNASEQAFYRGVRHSILQAYASQEWLCYHQNLDDLLPDDEAHRVMERGYPLIYMAVVLRRFGKEKVKNYLH
jgi:hypothetical protein